MFALQNDIFNELEPHSKLEDASQSSSASSIQPGQKAPSLPVSWATQTNKKSPEDYARDKAKYAQYFQGNRILPIPELIKKVENKTLSFIITDNKTKRRRIKVTVCNVPIQLSEDVIAAYLTEYGDVEVMIKAKSTNGTAHGDHYFTMYLNRTWFQSIPHTIEYENQTMIVVVEGRKPQCWNCKQLGHFSRTCPSNNHQTNIINFDHSDNDNSNYHLD